MAKSSKEISDKALEAVRLAKASGTVRKGVNEVTKSVERGLASLVVMAEDVEPQEILMHIPKLCDQKKIVYSYVPTKMDLGKAVGINVPCSAVSIEKTGEAEAAIKSITGMTTGKAPEAKPEPKKEAPAAPKEHKEKKEKAPTPPA
ncbi:MAG TPA: 50S ribosomal protein L7Ae, partial [Candidatus Saccharimonadales bacterium]|nr:50S ribosomal protein L7Ae [Candidatus Saccharimonadales bacterium]